MFNLVTDIVVRICIITAVFSVLSYYLIRKYATTQSKLQMRISLLFVVFGVVILVNVLYVLERYHVMTTA
jgi:hypothetical protein